PRGGMPLPRVAAPLRSLVLVPLVQLPVHVASNSVPTTVYWQRPRSVSRGASATQVITGASVSLTVTSKLQLIVFPLASVTSKVLVVVPTGNILPLGKPAV